VRTPFLSIGAVLALAAAACGGGAPADFYVHDTGIRVESTAPFATQPDLPSRVEGTVAAALAYWGADWTVLRGRTITLSGAPFVSCGGNPRALGCSDGDIRVTTSDPGIGTFRCVEETVLVHEIGHAVLGDPLHEDPRWMELAPVADELAGRVGYTTAGEADCAIYVSVWRHPLNSP
jgi:hypothetical protein